MILHESPQSKSWDQGSQKSGSHLNIRIEKFEADIFRQLMEFVHTSRIELQPRTVIGQSDKFSFFSFQLYWVLAPGVLCAAHTYHLHDLLDGALQFFPTCCKVWRWSWWSLVSPGWVFTFLFLDRLTPLECFYKIWRNIRSILLPFSLKTNCW